MTATATLARRRLPDRGTLKVPIMSLFPSFTRHRSAAMHLSGHRDGESWAGDNVTNRSASADELGVETSRM